MMKTVSVVIPAYNEEAYIENCVSSILASNYPKDLLQVLVCDGQSTDATQEIVREIAEENIQVVLLQNLQKTTPYALNLGLKYSKADVKIILGAHSTVDANFVLENVKVLEEKPEVACAGGVIENVYENHVSESIGLAMSSRFGVGNAHFRTGAKSGYVDTVAFGAYRKEVFEQVGYFDGSLTRNQDDDFNFRVTQAGFKIYLEPKIKCKYFVRGSLNKLYRQYFQYGYWKVFVNKKHGAFLSIRQLVPPLFVLYILLGLMLSAGNYWLRQLYGLGLSFYLLAAFFSAVSVGKNLKSVMQVFTSFLILHFSYGLGYLKGVFDFMVLKKQPAQKAQEITR